MPDTTVLVVDPDGTRRAETVDTIREQVQGVSVLQAGSLAEARRHLGDGDADVDALVTEYDLGDGTGLELAAHVRSLPRDIGCVLYTAEQDIETDSFEETVVWHVTDEDDPEALGLAVEGVGPDHSQAAYPLPENEDQRLAVVEAHADADGALVGPLTRLSTLAATHFGAETASVNLVREHTQESLAHHGGEWAPTAREDSICTYTVLEDRTMAVPDTREDPRFADVDAIAAAGIRAYLGANVEVSGEHAVGVLCVYDDEPRSFSPDDREYLSLLADVAADVFALHRRRDPEGGEAA